MDEKFTLKQWRNIRGLTQRELANLVGVTPETVGNWEQAPGNLGNSSYYTVRRVADALGVKTGDIFLNATSEKPKQKV